MDIGEYQQRFAKDSAPGWDAINARLSEVYGDQEPMHWGTAISYMLGGPDPLDGISAYCCKQGGRDHQHFVTYGYSMLYYDEASVGNQFSQFGFEMTFRLAGVTKDENDLVWVANLLQNIARYVFKSGKWFDNYHWIPTNGPIRAEYATDIVGLAIARDPVLQSIDTPHGRVDFLQAFGITAKELDDLKNKSRTCEEIVEQHRKSNPLLITDLGRRD